jgi:AraC-like DNA-binding protein
LHGRFAEVIRREDESIDRIGRMSGLGTPAKFRRIFAQNVGIMPSEYRRMYRGCWPECIHSCLRWRLLLVGARS